MIVINIDEKREYFKNFKYESLSSDENNKQVIKDFKATDNGSGLEWYLKNKAWEDDESGETRVFLVKDANDKLALFFSVKCGLLYEQYLYDKLKDDERDFVNYIIDAKIDKDTTALKKYYELGVSLFGDENIDKLFKVADIKFDVKKEGLKIEDTQNTLKVSKCFAAIEVQHFCKNENYEIEKDIGVPLGFGLFWEIIVPHIEKIINQVGCKYLYLFAADTTEKGEVKKLVKYYKTALKFNEVEDINIIKPEYDKYCYGLVQSIRDLLINRDAVWEQISDI